MISEDECYPRCQELDVLNEKFDSSGLYSNYSLYKSWTDLEVYEKLTFRAFLFYNRDQLYWASEVQHIAVSCHTEVADARR